MLSETDKMQYGYLRMVLSQQANKNVRNKRIETFTDTINTIKQFCVRGDNDDWKRCLVCGLAWIGDDLAVNTHQLRLLIFKCKSSINGSILKAGYNHTLGRVETAKTITRLFPILKDNMSEIRQWTIRRIEDNHSTKQEEPENSTILIDNVFQNFFEESDLWSAETGTELCLWQ